MFDVALYLLYLVIVYKCGLILLYYNAIYDSIIFWNMLVHPKPILHQIHITIVTLIIKLAYVGAPKPLVSLQHICCICNFIIELGMMVPPNPFCTTYMLN